MKVPPVHAVAATIGFFASVALAAHIEPAKANKFTFELTNGFVSCDGGSANTATNTGGLNACAPASPAGGCAFTATGHGKLIIAKVGSSDTGNQDLKISAAATGLNPSCGDLHIRLSFRLTTDDCPEGTCTTVELDEFSLQNASCIVNNGKCKIKTTLNTAYPGLIATNGKNVSISILGCGLKTSFAPPSPSELQCGILLK